MNTQIAACICIALTQQCLGDETVFTCKGGAQHSYIAEGGHEKPGWSAQATLNVTKLIRTDLAKTGSFFDIQVTTQHGTTHSDFRKCLSPIKEISQFEVLGLDKALVVTCKEMISKLPIFTREAGFLSIT